MKLYLMRHCLTDDGPRMDPDRALDDVGREQAKAIKKFLKRAEVNPDIVISSDFARALDTAKIVNRGVTIETTPALRPPPDGLGSGAIDAQVKAAWKAITTIAGDSKAVLVVTHGPLIEALLSSVAFSIDRVHWYHGSVAYVNTHENNFRWFVTPKLAAHLVGKEPKDVEAPAHEALARQFIELSDNLIRAVKEAGGELEKRWVAEDGACEDCQANEADGWIPEDESHSSGDDEPPLHPNCRCTEEYREAGEEE